MPDTKSITGRFIGLFLFGCFLFSYPVLTIFNLQDQFFGIPLFFLYFFAAWLVLIILIVVCGKMPSVIHKIDSPGDKSDIP